MTGPFHRLSILNPDLSAVGYGRYENGGCWSAALDLHLRRPQLKGEERVTMFPPDGATISMPEFDGREWPNPLAGCPEYEPPVGLPITLQIGEGRPISLDSHAISMMGKTVEHCGFDFATYRSANRSEQQLVSQILQEYGAIVLIPREPLTLGATYKVSITAGEKYYNWSFTVGN